MTHRSLVIDGAGWLQGVRHVESPNWDRRPAETPVDLLVVHAISLPPGEYGGPWIDALFTNTLPLDAHPYFSRLAGLRVSSHLLVHRDGSLVQYVSFAHRAWHAGVSQFAGRHACNDFSIGIELEGSDDAAFDPRQYRVLANATRALMERFPGITAQRIVGHSDIAPGRKSDPGPAFDWIHFRRLLAP